MYDTILVPTDGSDYALAAADHAGSLASTVGATVHLLAVADVDDAAGPFSVGGVDQSSLDRLERDAEERLAAARTTLPDGVPVETATERGRPAGAILEYVEGADADLVVMGTHGRTGVRRLLTGSVTESVLRRSPVPVLTVGHTASDTDAYDDILLPTDGSEAATAAVDDAVDVARTVDAALHVVYIADVTLMTGGAGAGLPKGVVETMHDVGREAVDPVATRAAEDGVETTVEVREGVPAPSLVEYAEDTGVDMVAMGTSGRTGLRRVLLGSTTERVIRHAARPVLAVTPDCDPTDGR